MTTITVQVDNIQNVVLLEKMLKALSFVEAVYIQTQQPNMVEEARGLSDEEFQKEIDNTEGNLKFDDRNTDPTKW